MYAAPTALTRLATLSDFTSLSEIRLNRITAACMGMRACAAVGSEAFIPSIKKVHEIQLLSATAKMAL